jgi:crotonobetainyl-CoA:carnitine CoA-transferase CaiB-like acyl-CoA transferase
MNSAQERKRPLFEGLKVVEFAHMVAGPLAGTLLADLGADVVHVENPGTGDIARHLGVAKDGVNLLWPVGSRNKRSVTLDLRQVEGQELARELVAWADVVITNFRVETLEKWGMDWPAFHAVNPKLVMLQITGYGADTSMRNAPGFGHMGEAMSGVVHLTGFPDGPPVHTGFAHADSVTALMGAFAISSALTKRHDPDFDGEWIDLALFESLYRLIEWQVIVYDQLGIPAERAGNQLPVAPGAVINTYLTADDKYVTVTCGTPRSVQNLVRLLELPAEDFLTAEQQGAGRDHLDQQLREWVATRTAENSLEQMHAQEVVAARVYSAADIVTDPIYAERNDIITVEDPNLGPVRMQAVIPRLHNHAGHVWRTGPALGQDNDLVYQTYLELTDERYAQLRAAGTI